jgi:hypothetical protein
MGEGGGRAASTATSPFGAPVAGFREKWYWIWGDDRPNTGIASLTVFSSRLRPNVEEWR